MTSSKEGQWAKYAWHILIAIAMVLAISAIVSFLVQPMIGVYSFLIPLIAGFVALGFVYYNREKFYR